MARTRSNSAEICPTSTKHGPDSALARIPPKMALVRPSSNKVRPDKSSANSTSSAKSHQRWPKSHQTWPKSSDLGPHRPRLPPECVWFPGGLSGPLSPSSSTSGWGFVSFFCFGLRLRGSFSSFHSRISDSHQQLVQLGPVFPQSRPRNGVVDMSLALLSRGWANSGPNYAT